MNDGIKLIRFVIVLIPIYIILNAMGIAWFFEDELILLVGLFLLVVGVGRAEQIINDPIAKIKAERLERFLSQAEEYYQLRRTDKKMEVGFNDEDEQFYLNIQSLSLLHNVNKTRR